METVFVDDWWLVTSARNVPTKTLSDGPQSGDADRSTHLALVTAGAKRSAGADFYIVHISLNTDVNLSGFVCYS